MAKLIRNVNDLKTLCPNLAKQWHPTLNGNLKPTDVTMGSGKKVWWICKHGHEWESSVDNRTRHNSGCPYCSGKRPIKGKTDLITTNPEIAAEWDYEANNGLTNGNGRDISTPDKVSLGTIQKIGWKCKNGHTWKASVNDRTSGCGCPVCSNKKVVLGKNDLATTHPELAKQWHPIKNGDLKPTDVTHGSEKKVWWQCEHGHEWKSFIYHRTSGRECPFCSESKGEKAVRKILEDKQISFKTQYKFKDRYGPSKNRPLRDDFAIFDNNGNVIGTIEYHGEQHYNPRDFSGKGLKHAQKEFKKTKSRDSVKTQYLQEHNIPQLIIPYWEFDNIEKLVNDFLFKLHLKLNLTSLILSV